MILSVFYVIMMRNTSRLPPNRRLQRTALCARKIAAFLKAGISLTAISSYGCAAAEAQAVSPPSIKVALVEHMCDVILSIDHRGPNVQGGATMTIGRPHDVIRQKIALLQEAENCDLPARI